MSNFESFLSASDSVVLSLKPNTFLILSAFLLNLLWLQFLTVCSMSRGFSLPPPLHCHSLSIYSSSFPLLSVFLLSFSLRPIHLPHLSFSSSSPSLILCLSVLTFILLPRSLSFFIMHQLLCLMSTSVKAFLMKSLSFAI